MDRTKVKAIGKKILKALKVFVICSIILTLLEVGTVFLLLKTRWQLFISKQEMKEFASELTNSEPLPENFLRIYKTIYPKHVDTSLNEMLVLNYATRFFFRDNDYDSKPHCFCDLVYDIQVLRNEKLRDIEWVGRIVDLEYAFGLEKYTTPDKCFRYFMNDNIKMLEEHLDHTLYPNVRRDKIAAMTDDEIIEVILLVRSPERFNRFANPELFEKYLDEYRLKLTMAGTNSK